MTEFFNTPSEPDWYENDVQNKKTREDEVKAEIRQKALELSEVSKQLLERLKEKNIKPETAVVQEQYEYKRDLHLGFLERRRPSSVGNRYRQKDSVDVGKGWVISSDGPNKAGQKVIILMENGEWRLGRDITETKSKKNPPEQVQDLGVINLDDYPFHKVDKPTAVNKTKVPMTGADSETKAFETTTGYIDNTQALHSYSEVVRDENTGKEHLVITNMNEATANVYANIQGIERDLRTRGRELLGIK